MVYFCCMLFTSLLCDVTPVVCQTKGRRCFMWSLSLSLFFQTCIHFHLFIYLKRRPPTQCCDTAFLGIGWQCGSRGISLFFFLALSPFFPTRCLLVTRIHTLPASSIITPPSIQDTAESWCCQPEPDALSHSNMRHLSGLAPPPCCSLSSRYTSVARVTGFGLFWKVGGGMCYFKPKNFFCFLCLSFC